MKSPWVIADRWNRRLCMRGEEGLTKDIAIHVAEKRVGPDWELIDAVFEAEGRVNVYFRKNGTLGKRL